jgi:hypothetical protein
MEADGKRRKILISFSPSQYQDIKCIYYAKNPLFLPIPFESAIK